MVTKTIYKCELCGQEFEVAQDARKCEDSHMDADVIVSQSFNRGEQYPAEIIVSMENEHKLIYKYFKPVIVEPSDQPYFTNISASRDSVTQQIILTAIGERIPEHDDFTWVLLCDDTRIPLTSTTPTVILSPAATNIFDLAFKVRAKVSTPTIEAQQFVVKDEL